MTHETATILYNGACPLCRREIEHYQREADREGVPFIWTDITETDDAGRAGLALTCAMRRLHAIDDQGQLLSGIDAFLVIWTRLPRWRWLARLTSQPLIRPFAEWLYERVAAPLLFWWNTR